MTKNFWKERAEKGPIVALAPMDGFTDSPYRLITKKVAPEIVAFAEFYSADGLVKSEFLADRVLPHLDGEKPVIFQIFGNNPEMFAKAGVMIENYGAGGIDINMGCPAKKVVKNGYGSGLMTTPDIAFEIVKTLSEATNLPVSVKTRLPDGGAEQLIEFGKKLELAGANLITVHGRTYANKHSGEADFEAIYALQDSLKIPVLANGGIEDYDDGIRKQKNLAGFMIARSSMGNPWCFLKGGYVPNINEICDIMKLHVELFVERSGEKIAITHMRKHLVSYVKGFEGVKEFRLKLATSSSVDGIYETIEEIRNHV